MVGPSENMVRQRGAPAPGADPRGAASRPTLLVLFDDTALLERVEPLLKGLGRCTLSRLAAPASAPFDAAPLDAECEDPPSLVVFALSGTAMSARACTAAVNALQVDRPGVSMVVFMRELDEALVPGLIRCGVFDFATFDCSDGELRLRLERALGRLCARPDVDPDDDAATHPLGGHLVGHAPKFLKLVRRIPVMAATDASILLLGETGTGKEVCAQALHYCSPRAHGPWVPINCAAVPHDLLEDELFGHVRGAYTHATGSRQGLVHEAEGGTLFLDEVDSMPLAAQAKLLRFLQEKQYRVVGANELRTANVRVIAASNRDLRQDAARGRFRQDLFFRLNVLSLTLPPLRERPEDVPLLALHFLERISHESGRRVTGIAPAAMRVLASYAWPGNVRELKHAVQRAVLLAQGPSLQPSDIELDDAAPADDEPVSFREAKARAVEHFERRYIEQLLLESEGNISRAARIAQKNRRAFFELLRRHGIDAANYRSGLN